VRETLARAVQDSRAAPFPDPAQEHATEFAPA
jgi:hypothetical protein